MRKQPMKPWISCNLAGWMKLLALNRFQFDLRYLPYVLAITPLTLHHFCARHVQEWLIGRKIDAVPLNDEPVFIIGHWRSGTTFLHTLMSQDRQFLYPTSFQCFNPNHFSLTGPVGKLLMRPPKKRPMDDLGYTPDSPQEDEFMFMNLGLPSPYARTAFPNNPDPYPESLDLDGMDPAMLERWKKTFIHFLKEISMKEPRKVLLKSPTHSCRIRVLLDLFPKARFVHIVRSPYSVIPSTLNMWRALYPIVAIQRPTFQGLEESVFQAHDHLMKRIDATRGLVPPGQFAEVKFEEIVAKPVEGLEAVYRTLKLDGFEKARPDIERHVAAIAGYKKRHWELDPELKKRIGAHCEFVIRKYNYG